MISFTRVVHMVLALAVTFIGLAGVFIILEAEFVAFVQILIYGGAVTILMLFGIMMTKHEDDGEQPERPWHRRLLLPAVVILFGILFYAIQGAHFPTTEFNAGVDNAHTLGELLFNKYVIPFELVSVLLTVSFIGAIALAKKEDD